MVELKYLYLIIACLTLIQSIVGVGVLLLGTPLLLFFNYEIIEIMITLLPISIITSLASIFSSTLKKSYYRNILQ